MAQSAAKIAAGPLLKLGDGASPEVFSLVAEVTQLGEIGQTAPEVEVTPIDATERLYIGGLKEGNSVGFTLSYVAANATHKTLRDSLGQRKNFTVEWVDGSSAEFTLVINNFARGETTAEGVLTANLEGRITGDITYGDPT
jgi:hypothetical protein